ncbi:MAG: hypothetical protein ACUVTP_08570 [Candidatus Fervidibacter sp.]|uniref:hypothetical protein n=1 Tax=Candidatus Fervidibacter sp. TaxID=3100871 RepID=UPI00404A3FEE
MAERFLKHFGGFQKVPSESNAIPARYSDTARCFPKDSAYFRHRREDKNSQAVLQRKAETLLQLFLHFGDLVRQVLPICCIFQLRGNE